MAPRDIQFLTSLEGFIGKVYDGSANVFCLSAILQANISSETGTYNWLQAFGLSYDYGITFRHRTSSLIVNAFSKPYRDSDNKLLRK